MDPCDIGPETVVELQEQACLFLAWYPSGIRRLSTGFHIQEGLDSRRATLPSLLRSFKPQPSGLVIEAKIISSFQIQYLNFK